MSRSVFISVLSILAIGIMLFYVGRGSAKKTQKSRSPDTDFIGRSFPVPEAVAAQRISSLSKGEAGTNRRLALPGKFEHFQLAEFQDPLFPPDFLLEANSEGNPALRRYGETPNSSRQNDFYVFSPTNLYWASSEYTYGKRPARFTCSFILHLEPLERSNTRIDVIEYLPRMLVGKKLGWSGHTGPFPQLFDDIRIVSPTVEDRLELLNDLGAVLAATH
jgi:hypothetical protein